MESESKMTKGKWFIIFFLAGCVDLMQIILDFFVVGIVVNRFIDIGIGFLLPLFFHTQGVSMADPKRLLSIIATLGFEIFPGVDALPLWTLDVAYIYSTTKVKEVVTKASPETLQKLNKVSQGVQNRIQKRQPLNQNGVRQPSSPEERNRIVPLQNPRTITPEVGSNNRMQPPRNIGGETTEAKKSSENEMSFPA